MTLNVDLEEVPFAILEAVKARILANRRRLQQGQQQGPKPSLRPRPQRPRIGASSKSWRMPKEAAVLAGDDALIVSWDGTTPKVSDSSLGSLGLSSSFGISTGLISGVPAAVFQGETGAEGTFIFEVPSLPSQTSDFSVECYGQHVVAGTRSTAFYVELLMIVSDGVYGRIRAVSTYEPEGSIVINPDPGLFASAVVEVPGYDGTGLSLKRSSNAPAGATHICVQRINGVFYLYFDGELLLTYSEATAFAFGQSEFILYAVGYTGSSPVKLGQARYSLDEALYSQASFTPNPLPFT